VEFAEHKEYSPGDDLRHLDWKAYGKFDRYYVKRFEDETELKAYLMLDCSGSMGYGKPLSKLEYGSVLLASLAYFLTRQGDQPGLLAYADKARIYVPPRARSAHISEILRSLEGLSAGGGTDLAGAVSSLIEVMGHRTLTVVASDLFDESDGALRLLRRLRARRHQVVLFHLLHRDELELPFQELTLFQSMEGKREVLVDPGGIRKAYLQEIQSFLARTRQACRESEIEYHQVSCSEPIHEVLLRLLRPGSGR
jgi:uncharacterized protein (DUF58 family)